MATLRCKRFREGVVPIRATNGAVVDFRDGIAEVEDPELVEALLEVPPVFQIELVDGEVVQPPAPDSSAPRIDMPPGMSVTATEGWVKEGGEDAAERAKVALAAETADGGQHRSTLIARLEAVIAAADADADASTQS